MFNQYKGVANILGAYWAAYGGLEKLLGSPYLHAALVLLALTLQTWTGFLPIDSPRTEDWWEQSLSVLPNLLGFTLGGFAIFISFGDEQFRALLSEPHPESEVNDYLALCATFVHFILVQALALFAAVLGHGLSFYTPLVDPIRHWLPWLNTIGGAVGYGLFLYALTSVLAATMHVFRIARMYADFQSYKGTP